jgi:hypothetical protein
MPPKTKKTTMTAAHKAALAAGRSQSKTVREYLAALEANRPKRGRPRTAETVKKQLAEVQEQLAGARGAVRLELIQDRRDLEVELATLQAGSRDISALEREFVKVAKAYAERKGISHAAFREFGVPADVLKRAGVARGA